MKCLYCEAEMEKGNVPFHIDRKGIHVTLDEVSAWVLFHRTEQRNHPSKDANRRGGYSALLLLYGISPQHIKKKFFIASDEDRLTSAQNENAPPPNYLARFQSAHKNLLDCHGGFHSGTLHETKACGKPSFMT